MICLSSPPRFSIQTKTGVMKERVRPLFSVSLYRSADKALYSLSNLLLLVDGCFDSFSTYMPSLHCVVRCTPVLSLLSYGAKTWPFLLSLEGKSIVCCMVEVMITNHHVTM